MGSSDVNVNQRNQLLLVTNNFKYSKYAELISGENGCKCVNILCKGKFYKIEIEHILSKENPIRVHVKKST